MHSCMGEALASSVCARWWFAALAAGFGLENQENPGQPDPPLFLHGVATQVGVLLHIEKGHRQSAVGIQLRQQQQRKLPSN